MAIGRISGALLFSDLDRQSTDLAFTTNGRPLTYMDFTNFRFGVNTNSLVNTFTVSGTANVSGNTFINGNLLANSTTSSTNTTTGALVVRGGVGIGGAVYSAGNIQIQTATDSAITTNQPTAYVFNETATTVRIGGGGVTQFNNNTQATSTSTGAVQLQGGMSIAAGNLYIQGSGGNALVTTDRVYAGNVYVTSDIYWAGNNAQFTSNVANWLTIIESPDDNVAYNIPYIGDVNSGAVAGTPRRLYSDATGITYNPNTNTLTVGPVVATTITGSQILSTTSNTQATSTTTGALRATGGLAINTGNVYIGGSGGNAIVSRGDLYNQGNIWTTAATNTGLKTTTATAYIFNETATVVKIAGGGVAEFDNNTQATSTTTGAIQLAGGMSIASGNLYIAGSAGNSIIATGDISVTSNVRASNLIGNLTSVSGDVNINPFNNTGLVVINATSALQLPSGTTAEQPSAYGGALRWNNSSNTLEVYTGSSWISLLSQINNQIITPDNDGINTVFTLDYSTTAEGIIVSINGTLQQPGTAYTVAGTLITFADPPLSTDIISIRFIAAGTAPTPWAGGSVASNIVAASGSSSTNTATGALVVVGGVGISGNINVAGSGGNALVTTSNVSARVRPTAGSASAGTAPIRFTPGTLLATPESGAVEFAANIPYVSTFPSARGVIPSMSFVCRTGTKIMNNDPLLQSIFGGGTGGLTSGALTVDASTTYFFEMQFNVTSMAVNSGNFGFSLVGAGTATFTSCQFMVTGDDTDTPTDPAAQDGTFVSTPALTTNILIAATKTAAYCMIRGIFRIANAGTIIPSIQLTHATAAVIGANSWFRCYPVGTDTVVSVGNWS